jgi:hypothetical protein
VATPPLRSRACTSTSNRRASSTRSAFPPTRYSGRKSLTCSSGRSGGRRTTCSDFYKSFRYRAASWPRPRRVVAKVEWHHGELFPRVGFIVTNLRLKSANAVEFYNKRGTCEQWSKEGKNAIKWTRLSCRSFNANTVRLQLHALACNLGNFLRALPIPEAIAEWSLTTLREKLIKIGAKVVNHGRYVAF